MKISKGLIVVILLLNLVACGGGGDVYTSPNKLNLESGEQSGIWYQPVRLPDGRTLDCAVWESGGLSCDWARLQEKMES